MNSIDYYNNNSTAFYDRTIHADLHDIYKKFLKYLPKKGRILEAGCGVGRDSKFFLSQGYDVTPFDGSIEMVKLATNVTGLNVLHMNFHEMSFSSEFDAIWAQASLLHVPYENLREIFQRFHDALLPSGILYASFKYGSYMRQVDDRFFFDMNEITVAPYLKGFFHPLEIWKSPDSISKIAASPDKSWLNFIAKRV